ncbi:hypothetical protein J3Q64DRAFT_1704579 [Phycomyces blakesleeanus]|uniref:Uncharacterized protein n=2 Tax=Phycomyces blakesleeanus TaxID=4837 RepID=A0A167LC12_PHYB8|nr:hypothetical protein PHYBLDRAFT_71535 [Phycomyces blakesleeanus NRRL 1555(-)]OAD70097.1 hypothetical protein PHYBLDRAFT_71535 [Phycomyces blakesleeanus NRRL 1555(-)]|eukprot:XP_018288137.1 hypothetical protein PHYBLDRAFT_71535 [Phycomyces blakesleeanus NRRL 1555(-)]
MVNFEVTHTTVDALILSQILSEYGLEHKFKHFDARRFFLPRPPGLFPKPALDFWSIRYINRLKPAIISASRDTTEIVFRAKIFVNYYITLRSQQLQNNDISHCIFTQQFWYSVCQMIEAGASQCIAEVCTELATCY